MNEAVETNRDPLRQTFAPLIGLPAWFVRKGRGSGSNGTENSFEPSMVAASDLC
jgi:hypothetical protein